MKWAVALLWLGSGCAHRMEAFAATERLCRAQPSPRIAAWPPPSMSGCDAIGAGGVAAVMVDADAQSCDAALEAHGRAMTAMIGLPSEAGADWVRWSVDGHHIEVRCRASRLRIETWRMETDRKIARFDPIPESAVLRGVRP